MEQIIDLFEFALLAVFAAVNGWFLANWYAQAGQTTAYWTIIVATLLLVAVLITKFIIKLLRHDGQKVVR